MGDLKTFFYVLFAGLTKLVKKWETFYREGVVIFQVKNGCNMEGRSFMREKKKVLAVTCFIS